MIIQLHSRCFQSQISQGGLLADLAKTRVHGQGGNSCITKGRSYGQGTAYQMIIQAATGVGINVVGLTLGCVIYDPYHPSLLTYVHMVVGSG